MSPLARAAREMRDIYANEIARDVVAGRAPTTYACEAWVRYNDEAERATAASRRRSDAAVGHAPATRPPDVDTPAEAGEPST